MKLVSPKLTKEDIEEASKLARRGLPLMVIAARLKMKPGMIFYYKKTVPEFAAALECAQSYAIEDLLAKIAAGDKGWQGCCWILERRYPHLFSKYRESNIGYAAAIINELKDRVPIEYHELLVQAAEDIANELKVGGAD